MSTKLSCNEQFYQAIEKALACASAEDAAKIAVVEMVGGTPAIHRSAALHFAAKIKDVIDNAALTPSAKLEHIERMIAYVQKYQKDAKKLSERVNDAEQRAAAADARAEELQKQLDEILKEKDAKHDKDKKDKKK